MNLRGIVGAGGTKSPPWDFVPVSFLRKLTALLKQRTDAPSMALLVRQNKEPRKARGEMSWQPVLARE